MGGSTEDNNIKSYDEDMSDNLLENQQGEGYEEEDDGGMQKTTSLETVGSLINQMMGGTMLALPILFAKNGIIGGFFNMAIQGLISCKTCLIYLLHFKKSEKDFSDSIRRILGKNYQTLFKIVKFCQTFLLQVLYFYLITTQLYMLVAFVIESAAGDNASDYYVPLSNKDDYYTFDRFSQQYMSIIAALICGFFTFQKELVIVVKIASYGLYSIFGFVVFIIFVFIDNVSRDRFRQNTDDITLFDWDLGKLAGTASLAFCVQISAGPTIKCNLNQENNRRDIMLTYFGGATMYIAIGILGSLAIIGNCKDEDATLINECFSETNVANLIIILTYAFNLITSFPIYFKIMKSTFFDAFNITPTDKIETIFNISCITLSFIVRNIKGLDPDLLMSLNGAVCCFFVAYFIPIVMHMKCYHGTNKLLNTIKRSISRVGLMKPDANDEQIARHKARLQKEKNRFISFKQAENKSYVESKKKLQQFQSVQIQPLDADKKTIMISQNEQEQQQQKDIDFENANKQIPSIYDSQLPEDDKETPEEEIGSNNFQSCNDHDDDIDYTTKTARIVMYAVIGSLGLSILVYELYQIIAKIIEAI